MDKQLLDNLRCGLVARKAHWGTLVVGLALWAGVLLLLTIGF